VRRRLLMGMVGAIVVLAAALPTLAVAGRAPHGTGTPVQVHPAAPSGVCLPATQQCAPVLPHVGGGATPTTVVVGLLVAVALLTLARVRVRRRSHAGPLAPGFVTTLLHPPQAGLGTV
jgi:MYXO-CTERM domain-containing protein